MQFNDGVCISREHICYINIPYTVFLSLFRGRLVSQKISVFAFFFIQFCVYCLCCCCCCIQNEISYSFYLTQQHQYKKIYVYTVHIIMFLFGENCLFVHATKRSYIYLCTLADMQQRFSSQRIMARTTTTKMTQPTKSEKR